MHAYQTAVVYHGMGAVYKHEIVHGILTHLMKNVHKLHTYTCTMIMVLYIYKLCIYAVSRQ